MTVVRKTIAEHMTRSLQVSARAWNMVEVDMESGVLASSGRLVGVVRAVSDAADEPVGRLVCAAKADGGTDWRVVARAFLLEPLRSLRTALAARRAFASLRQAASALAQEPVRG